MGEKLDLRKLKFCIDNPVEYGKVRGSYDKDYTKY